MSTEHDMLISCGACHWVGCAIGRGVPLGRVYHWAGCAIGRGVPLGGVCHWAGCAIGRGVPLGGVCHWAGCAIDESPALFKRGTFGMDDFSKKGGIDPRQI